MKMLIIAIVLAVRAWYLDATNTAYDDCRSYAYNESTTVWNVPDALWERLEAQARKEGYTDGTELVCAKQPWCYECQPENRD